MANEVRFIISADSTGLEQGLKKVNTALVSGTIKVEDAYKNLGIKSDQVYNMMRANATAAADFIKNKTLSSTEEITRAQKAAANQIAQINNEQFGHQTSIIDKLKANWLAASAVIASAGIIAKQGWDMAKEGAEFREQTGILDNLAKKYNTTAISIVSDMRKASDGLVADSDLMQISLAGIAKGLKPDQLTNLADAARLLGDAVGKDATTALRDLTEALGTGRTKGLKTYLGTALDLETVFGDLTSKMTAAEKTQAMYTIVMQTHTELQKRQAKVVDDTSDKIERLEAKWKNLLTTIKGSMADVVGVFLGSAAQDEQAKLARARVALMKSKDFDYVALNKMSVKDRNAYLDSVVAAENAWSESRFAPPVKNPQQAEIDALKKVLQGREDAKSAPKDAAKVLKEASAAQKQKLDADVKAFEFGMKMEEEWAKIQADHNKDIEEAQKKKMDADVKAFELGMKYEDDAAKEAKENAKDKADAYRTMYGDMKEDTQAYYIYQLTSLDEEKKAYEDLKINQNQIDKWYEAQKKKIDNNLVLRTGTFFEGIKVGYDNSLQDQMTWAKSGAAIFNSFATNSRLTLSTLLFDGIKGDLKSFDEYWDSFFDSLLKTFTDTIAEMAAQQISKGVISGLASVGGVVGEAAIDYATDSGWLDWLGGMGPYYHEGSPFIGGDQTPGDRLRQDEFLAILQRGEAVIPAGMASQARSGDFSGIMGMFGSISGTSLGANMGLTAGIASNFSSQISKGLALSGLEGLSAYSLGLTPSQALSMAVKGGLLGTISAGFQAVTNSVMSNVFGISTLGYGSKFGSIALGLLGSATLGPLGGIVGAILGSVLGSYAAQAISSIKGFLGFAPTALESEIGDLYSAEAFATMVTRGKQTFSPTTNAYDLMAAISLNSLSPDVEAALGRATVLGISLSEAMSSEYSGSISHALGLASQNTTDPTQPGFDFSGGTVGSVGTGADPSGMGPGTGLWRYGGLSSGPESGYTATLHGTEAIVPLPNGRSIPVEMSGGGDLASEIRQLRAEMKDACYAIAKNTGLAAKIFDRWDGDGIPAERVI